MKKKRIKDILTLLLAVMFILFFLAITIGLWYMVLIDISFISIMAGIFASIIPVLFIYSCSVATIEFVKESFFKWNLWLQRFYKGDVLLHAKRPPYYI